MADQVPSHMYRLNNNTGVVVNVTYTFVNLMLHALFVCLLPIVLINQAQMLRNHSVGYGAHYELKKKKKKNLYQPNSDRCVAAPEFLATSEILEVLIVLFSQLLSVLAVPDVLLRVNVEALRIARIPDRRDNGTSVFAVVDGVPVDAAEEGVSFDA